MALLVYLLTLNLVAVQNYITAIIIFLIVEMLMTWGFYGKDPSLLTNKSDAY